MNIRTTSFSLIIAASLGVAFSQTAKADDASTSATPGGMRFTFEPNIVKPSHAAAPRYVAPAINGPHAGAVPKNILGLDPTFVAKAPPPPVSRPMPAMPVPSVQATLQKPGLPDALQSIFGRPAPAAPALIAKGAEPLSPPQGATGKPASGPAMHVSKDGHAKLIHASKPRPLVAHSDRPIATYPGGYVPIQHLPGVGGQNGAAISLTGVVVGRHHH
jgi:hypothetical protein